MNNMEAFILERQRRILQIVTVIIGLVAILAVIPSIGGLFSNGISFGSMLGILNSFFLLGTALVVYWLSRSSNRAVFEAGALVLSAVVALLVTFSLMFLSFQFSTIVALVVIPLICAGLLLPPRKIFLVIGGVVLVFWIAFILGYTKIVPAPQMYSKSGELSFDLTAAIITTIALGLLGWALWYVQVNMRLIMNELSQRLADLARLSDEREQQRQVGLQVGKTVRNRAVELSEVSTQQESGANEQAVAVSEVAQTMEELSNSARMVSDSTRMVLDTASRTRQRAGNVKDTAEKASETTRHGLTLTATTTTSISQVEQRMNALERQLEELVAQSNHINGVVVLMRNVADQTHLLALNAAIESAGAGQYGARFGVVADEIKQLADNSLRSSRDIQQTISQLQSSISQVSIVVAQTRQQSQTAATQAQSAGEVISQLGQVIQVNSELANEILDDTVEVNRLLEEIALVTDMQQAATGQVTQTLRSVGQVARENAATTRQLTSTAVQLEVLSQQLTTTLSAEVRSAESPSEGELALAS